MAKTHTITLTNRQLQVVEAILIQHIALTVYDISHGGEASREDLQELEDIADIFTTEVEAQFASDIARHALTDEKIARFIEQSKDLDD